VLELRHSKQVQKISKVFHSLYHYEVREFRLPYQPQHKVHISWPWPEHTFVDERDLQILYYLGSTKELERDPRDDTGFMNFQACPFQQLP
jgi:hypothetical protein